jgi:ferrous iron transport protein B
MDRLMHRVGLPGKAFVPLLAAHACAIPAVMASRAIDDARDRLNTILIIPLMTCTARMPVFAMVVALLFPENSLYAAITFASAYVLAIVTALLIGFLFKRRLIPGRTKPLLIELPRYRMPSFRNAFLTSMDRSQVFVYKAGTTILAFSLVLWVLATYPRTDPSAMGDVWQQKLTIAEASGSSDNYDVTLAQAQSEYSFAGRMGKVVQPIFDPLGFDWRLSVGVINSFAAREVMVSTLAVLYGAGDEDEGLLQSLRNSRRPDGTPVFNAPTCLSLLVFYIYAMQCFPTLAVVRRELKSWKWPMFMLAYMSILAYGAAFLTYRVASIWA